MLLDARLATQKAAFLGELFVADWQADPQRTLFKDFFRFDRDGRRKGIIVLNLKTALDKTKACVASSIWL